MFHVDCRWNLKSLQLKLKWLNYAKGGLGLKVNLYQVVKVSLVFATMEKMILSNRSRMRESTVIAVLQITLMPQPSREFVREKFR